MTHRVLISLDDKMELGSGPTLRLTASVVEITEDNKLRNPSFDRWTRGLGDYADLRIDAHASRDFTPENFIYGEGPEYREVFSAGLQRCDAMAKTLKRIAKQFDAQREQLGEPHDVIDVIIRFAIAIKADGFVWRISDRNAWDYDGNEWRFADATAMRFHVEREHGEWLKRIGFVKVDA